ncbi:hypothetical protein GCM10009550_39320 [Actinocorallia libanotica]|uniref:Peptidase M43 pregnancy-associated plasma-A domain-containing protein n=2 Tax=Actinocorallia libanotica TaxID=46162 RepID=A0ABP4BV37_9ACTN
MDVGDGGFGEITVGGRVRLLGPGVVPAEAAQAEPLYVGEPAAIPVALPRQKARAEILSVLVRFPSGAVHRADLAIDDEDRASGSKTIEGVVSAEAGELHLFTTTRNDDGSVAQKGFVLQVRTRGTVQMYITPSFWTQSGVAGAPKFNFSLGRWECHAAVRWVNSMPMLVNLARRMTVRMTDAGTLVGTLAFDLSGPVTLLPGQTQYGTVITFHAPGSADFEIFRNAGDLTFEYSMSNDGFTPKDGQVWRTMREVGYNIIRVGDFTAAERAEYRRAAAEIASGIFRSRDMTVRGVELFRIEGTPEMEADKQRFRFIDSEAEIDELFSRYTMGDNAFLDAFFVEGMWDGSAGASNVNGPVDKQGPSSGILICRDADTVNLGQTFAHEAGHYLGLEHADEEDGCSDTDPASPNISDNFIFSRSRRDSTVVTGCQIDKMRRHGLVTTLTP